MVFTAHRLQCKTPRFPKHKFPVHATQNVQMQAEIFQACCLREIGRSRKIVKRLIVAKIT